MSELEDKLSAILGNPQMMQKITALAQSMGQGEPQQDSSPGFDPSMLRSLAGAAGQGGMDTDQRALLSALSPYLSPSRVSKLERAMRAAKIAGAASAFLSAGGRNLSR